MVSGHVREIKGQYHIVLSYTDGNGKRKSPSFSTNLPVKGNKKRAEKLLQLLQENFVIPKDDEELKIYKKFIKHQLKFGFEDANISRDEPIQSVEERFPIPARKKVKTRNSKADMLFGDYMSYWLESHKHNVSLSTYASYESQISTRIKPYFNEQHIRLGELTSEDIQEFYNRCMDGTLGHDIEIISSNTVIHYHANIRLALEYARKKRWVPTNEADLVTRPKKKQYIGSFYNEEELEKMFEIFKGTKLEFAVMMAAYYGLRRSEIVGLQWKNIDFERKVITIAHTVTEFTLKGKRVESANDKTKSKKSYRSLPLIPKMEELLIKMQKEQNRNRKLCRSSYISKYKAYIYVNEIGERIRPNYITTNFQSKLVKNGMRKIRFHDLRHSCATLLLSQDVSLKDIQEWLGHEDVTTTEKIYAHYNYKKKEKTAGIIAEIL
ncbi:tyrosine-type recombinase/integrase [Faecalicoccus pleomorphus]|uniref:tyrosine-type recombinase/integrase n=1 Tax=Faecalicoccus pleomorphus TaxID=1323 RepID=UPI0024317B5B|nr:tyrosine-type recombinase/integrase [Faecalicoccus pleomorphus]